RSLSVSVSEVYGGGKGTVCHTVAETDSWHENAIAAEPRGAMGITATPTSRSSASVRSPGRRCGPHRPTTVHVGRWRPVRRTHPSVTAAHRMDTLLRLRSAPRKTRVPSGAPVRKRAVRPRSREEHHERTHSFREIREAHMSDQRIVRPTPISGFPEWSPQIRAVEQQWLDHIRAGFES